MESILSTAEGLSAGFGFWIAGNNERTIAPGRICFLAGEPCRIQGVSMAPVKAISGLSMTALIQKLKPVLSSLEASKIQNGRIRQKRGRLVRHYFLISLVLISGGRVNRELSETFIRNQVNVA